MLKIYPLLGCAAVLLNGAAYAHPHNVTAGDREQVLANGQLHPIPAPGTGLSCDDDMTGAWYGLETAHHGPDAGDAGRGDDCYMTDDTVQLGQDVNNPVIH